MRDLDLEPRRAAAAGLVEAARRLRHDAFVAERERGVEKRLRGAAVARHEPRHVQLARHDLREPSKPLGERPVDEVFAVGVQAIEREQRQRQRTLEARDVELAAEPPHRVLERPRAALGRQREHLAVEDRSARRQRRDRALDLRHARRDVAPCPRKHAHAAVAFVDLHARAVELVLEHGLAMSRQRAVDVFRRAREHRRQRLVERQPKALERRAAARKHGACDGRPSPPPACWRAARRPAERPRPLRSLRP